MLINQRTGSYIGGVIWSRINAWFTPIIIKVKGRNNIQKNTSYVVIANHQSQYDIFIMYGWLGIDLKWIMKKELKKIPGIGFGSQKVGHIFLDRSNSRVAMESLNEAKKKLVNGNSVIIFPEGTRTKTGQMGTFKRGAFKLAKDLELPILPITIIGSKNILPTGTFDLFPGKAEMIIHEPFSSEEVEKRSLKELMESSKEIINSALPNK